MTQGSSLRSLLTSRGGSWSSDVRRRRLGIGIARGALVVLIIAGAVVAMGRLEAHVDRQILDGPGDPRAVFLDLPGRLVELALADLQGSVSDLLHGEWTGDSICRDMAMRLMSVGWLAKVHFVRRTAWGRFEVSGDYRLPAAMVQYGNRFLLVDGPGTRLPGVYRYDPSWMLVQGVERPPPERGELWEGDDLQAALAIIAALKKEPFSKQVTAVLVENFAGRLDPRRSHIELATDRAGGRIRWGSAPGLEIEENTVAQKLAILRANFRDTGRVDADYTIIDISTLPDRFMVPE